MKYLIIILALFITYDAKSAWKVIYIWEHEQNYGTYPRELDCYDNKNCAAIYKVALGKQFALRYTSDCGASWQTAINDTAYYIKDEQGNYTGEEYLPTSMWDFDCISEDFAVISCSGGYYYLSKDGFRNWTKEKLSTNGVMARVNFFNNRIGEIGNSGELHVTNDGAETWSELTPDFSDLDSNTYIDAVAWASENVLFLSAYNQKKDRSIILKSTNQGKDFERIDELKERVSCLYFVNEEIGFAGGGNQVSKKGTYMKNIYKTYDGGHNWKTKLFDFKKPYTSSIKKIEFSDSLNGIAWPYSTQLYETTDGGETWTIDTSYNMPYFCDDMPCPYGDWDTSFVPLSIVIDPVDCPDCVMNVFYAVRTTPDDCEEGSFIDMRITEIAPSAGCDSCAYNFADMMAAAIDSVLKEVSLANVPLGGCVDRLRFSLASCWGFFYEPALGRDVILPCNTQSCCWAKYEVCHIDQGIFMKNFIEGSLGDSADCHVNPHPCEMICGILEDAGVLGRFGDSPEVINFGEDRSIVVPNPTSGLVDILIQSEETGQATIEISDARGILITRQEIEKNTFNLKSTFDLEDNPNGIYFYRVFINNTLHTTGKLMLLK